MPYPHIAAAKPRSLHTGLRACLLTALLAVAPAALAAGADAPVRPQAAVPSHTDHAPEPDGHADTARGHGDGHRDERGDGHDAEPPAQVHLTPEQRRTLGLHTETLTARAIGDGLRAPGEARLNAYATAQVTPRIAAQVIARHARLGDRVAPGQPLVTLSSVEMAEAQGDLVVAELEWGRLDRIKDKFVSDKDYVEAGVARQKARSRVLAYGMTQAQIASLLANAAGRADGTFELLAPQAGTVIQDAFIQGELVQPGRVLFEITDETVRWIEAQLPPADAERVAVGDPARVTSGQGDVWLEGRVTQLHHRLDETTRTQAVRIEVPDPGHRLHPGVFVDVVILVGSAEPVLAIPEAAVLRSPDGDWQVFVAEGEDVFKPVEVELVRTAGGLAVIEGLAPGTQVVTQGAFFLQSELAKGGFDPHNH
jgi:RND family efflux transporter MFP subunit